MTVEKYFVDDRIRSALKSSLDEDIDLGMYSGQFLASAQSISRKLEVSSRFQLTPEEGFFLKRYVAELVGEEPGGGFTPKVDWSKTARVGYTVPLVRFRR